MILKKGQFKIPKVIEKLREMITKIIEEALHINEKTIKTIFWL